MPETNDALIEQIKKGLLNRQQPKVIGNLALLRALTNNRPTLLGAAPLNQPITNITEAFRLPQNKSAAQKYYEAVELQKQLGAPKFNLDSYKLEK